MNHPRRLYAAAGAAAVGAGLLAVVPMLAPVMPTRSVQAPPIRLTAGGEEIFAPDTSTFDPIVVTNAAPLYEVLQGSETWNLVDPPAGYNIDVYGTDTQTILGPITYDQFVETTETEDIPQAGAPVIDQSFGGTQIDLANFGGGFENEYLNAIDIHLQHTITDTVITPFGDYSFAIPTVDPLTEIANDVQGTISDGESFLNLGASDFAEGAYAEALANDLGGINTVLFGPGNDLLVDGADVLTGVDPTYVSDIYPAYLTTDIPETLQNIAAEAQGDFADALSLFGTGDLSAGVSDIVSGTDLLAFYPVDLIIPELVASVLGESIYQ